MRKSHIRRTLKHGLNRLVPEGQMKYLSLDLLVLDKGREYTGESAANELGLVLISGKFTVETGGMTFGHVGGRKDVFSGRASAVYVPPRTGFHVIAETGVEIAICKARASSSGRPQQIRPSDVKIKTVGQGNWRRKVHDIIYDNVPAQRLVLGETFNPPGNWSSSPPHKHDIHNPPREALMEEIYLFKISPEQGFGMQRLYDGKGNDKAYVLKNNDVILIHSGYHPVVAAPGYKLYYLWCLAGKGRTLIPRDDPDHAWIKGKNAK